MKKFLIFLVSIVVVVCVGLTTYYFMRNNEIITIKTREIYCNAGDTIPLESLGIKISKANVSKKTTFNYNANEEENEEFIKYDAKLKSYVVSQENGGEVKLIIRTSNKKYADFVINVHIGNGSETNPYYIFNETDLSRIGSTYRLDKHYLLMNDITLTSNFEPIGYNQASSSWDGFAGVFDGNGHTINGLNLTGEYANAGLFSRINSTAVVKNVTLNKANIAGSYANAGILAGVVAGKVEKVVVKNSNVTNSASNSFTGAIAGVTSNNNVVMSYAEGVKLNVAGTEDSAVTNAVVGGLFGKVNEATIQATYANNVEIKATDATAVSGGLAGEFVIGTTSGSIQQSYAVVASNNNNHGAFIGTIKKATGFNNTTAVMLRHLIGNIAVVYGKDSVASIVDADLVKNYDGSYFKNLAMTDRSAFYDVETAYYLIRGFVSAGDVIAENEFVFYAVDTASITNWDTTYVWNTNNNSLPTLRMGNIYPEYPSSEYLRRDLEQVSLGSDVLFTDIFSSDVTDKNIKFTFADDVVLNNWTPVAIKNSTIDGNNKTIKINLKNAKNNNLGLFTTIKNSTIKNLNIVVTGVSGNAKNAGALAGIIDCDDSLTTSSIENVTVTYENNFATPVIENFGGIAGTIKNTVIKNSTVNGLVVNADAQLENAGLIVGVNENGTIQNSTVNGTIYATTNVGGIAGVNKGTISNITGSVEIKYNKTVNGANAGGVVGKNTSVIDAVNITANITAENAGTTLYLGGIAGNNSGTISNVAVSGDEIAVADLDSTVYVGGVVANNSGTIENSKTLIANVGSYISGKNYYVGGVTAINDGAISKVLVNSNLNGNYVAGVTVEMDSSIATIDQVAVGIYDKQNKTFTANTIAGDKYVAGVVVTFKAGTITNVQSTSTLNGETNNTRSSLVALIFPYGATLKNATINSSFEGYGYTYRETWTDFASYKNKAEFGYDSGETGDARFNVYRNDTHHGSMQSVVINKANKGVSDAKAAMGGAFAWGKDYNDSSISSYIKVVNGFNDITQFQGKFEFTCATSSWLNIKHKTTKKLTFEIGSVWESNNGISLIFLNNI